MPHYPNIDQHNDYIMSRFDGCLIDGLAWSQAATLVAGQPEGSESATEAASSSIGLGLSRARQQSAAHQGREVALQELNRRREVRACCVVLSCAVWQLGPGGKGGPCASFSMLPCCCWSVDALRTSAPPDLSHITLLNQEVCCPGASQLLSSGFDTVLSGSWRFLSALHAFHFTLCTAASQGLHAGRPQFSSSLPASTAEQAAGSVCQAPGCQCCWSLERSL